MTVMGLSELGRKLGMPHTPRFLKSAGTETGIHIRKILLMPRTDGVNTPMMQDRGRLSSA